MVTAGVILKSAAPVIMVGPPDSVVPTVKSLVAFPKVRVLLPSVKTSTGSSVLLVQVKLSVTVRLLESSVRVPPVLVKSAPRLNVLPEISRVPASMVPPPVRVTVPPVLDIESEVEIVRAGVTDKSAAPVEISGPPESAPVTSTSLVLDPKVKV